MSSAGISDGVILAVSAVLMLVGTYILLGLKIAAQWEKSVVLRLGKFRNLAGPGAFWIIPILDPTALHLRAMNMLFEGLKEKGVLVIVPSSAVDTMNLGGLSGMVALAQTKPPEA
jgi:regulator of protease activity HflC (stomatin/prohibitin superfamily)